MNDPKHMWLDIAYSSIFCPHGSVFEGRWLGVRTAANSDVSRVPNDTYYAHCYLGGQGDPLTEEAKAALVDAVNFFRDNGAGDGVFPHHHWIQTDCPGPELTQFISQGIPRSGGGPAPSPSSGGIPDAVGFMGRPQGGGWIVAGDGGVFSIGDTPFLGSLGGQHLAHPIAGAASTPSGLGYWLFGGDGGVFTFGDAQFHGSAAGAALNAPVVGMACTADGAGYWLAGADGGVFTFGNATYAGSAANRRLAAPIAAMSAVQFGGYFLVGRDGGVFPFGQGAHLFGTAADHPLNAPVVSVVPTPTAGGYWLFAADGGVFAFGDAPFRGVYSQLVKEYGSAQRRIMGGAFVGNRADPLTWGYELFSDRLPVERYLFVP
jgi:hypothetical protein